MKPRILTALFGLFACVPHTSHSIDYQAFLAALAEQVPWSEEKVEKLYSAYNRTLEAYEHLFCEIFPPEAFDDHPLGNQPRPYSQTDQAGVALRAAYYFLERNNFRGAQANLNVHIRLRNLAFERLSYPGPNVRATIRNLRARYVKYLWNHGLAKLNALPGIERVRELLKMAPWDFTQETIKEFPEAQQFLKSFE